MSLFDDDFKEWMKDPEFEVQYWKTKLRLAQKEKTKFKDWVLDLCKDPSQVKYNPGIKEFWNNYCRGEYERGQLLISDEVFEELYPGQTPPWRKNDK